MLAAVKFDKEQVLERLDQTRQAVDAGQVELVLAEDIQHPSKRTRRPMRYRERHEALVPLGRIALAHAPLARPFAPPVAPQHKEPRGIVVPVLNAPRQHVQPKHVRRNPPRNRRRRARRILARHLSRLARRADVDTVHAPQVRRQECVGLPKRLRVAQHALDMADGPQGLRARAQRVGVALRGRRGARRLFLAKSARGVETVLGRGRSRGLRLLVPQQKVVHVQVDFAADTEVCVGPGAVGEVVEREIDDAVGRVLKGNHAEVRGAGLHGVEDVLDCDHGRVLVLLIGEGGLGGLGDLCQRLV